jgi:hypothetical protein
MNSDRRSGWSQNRSAAAVAVGARRDRPELFPPAAIGPVEGHRPVGCGGEETVSGPVPDKAEIGRDNLERPTGFGGGQPAALIPVDTFGFGKPPGLVIPDPGRTAASRASDVEIIGIWV